MSLQTKTKLHCASSVRHRWIQDCVLVIKPECELKNAGIARARDLHEVAAGHRAGGIREVYVVEQLERLEPELEFHGLAYGKILMETQVSVERSRAAEDVAPENAVSAQRVHNESLLIQVLCRNGAMAVVGKIRRHAREIGALAALTRTSVVLPAEHREREAATPSHNRRHVPAACKEIRQAIRRLQRQFPDAREVEHVLQVVVRRSAIVGLVVGIGDVGPICLIGRAYVVVYGLCPGVIGKNREALAEALLRGELQ